MSKIFYDHLVVLTEIDIFIKNSTSSLEEKEELWKIVDELVHHRIMEVILDNLPKEHHGEFKVKFMERPWDEELVIFINEKSGTKINDLIKKESEKIESEILNEIKNITYSL